MQPFAQVADLNGGNGADLVATQGVEGHPPEPLFVDTNTLIHTNVATAPLHKSALTAIRDAHQAGQPLWISRQVLREFIAALLTHNTKDFGRFGETIRIEGI